MNDQIIVALLFSPLSYVFVCAYTCSTEIYILVLRQCERIRLWLHDKVHTSFLSSVCPWGRKERTNERNKKVLFVSAFSPSCYRVRQLFGKAVIVNYCRHPMLSSQHKSNCFHIKRDGEGQSQLWEPIVETKQDVRLTLPTLYILWSNQ